jgi:hypothetical protein
VIFNLVGIPIVVPLNYRNVHALAMAGNFITVSLEPKPNLKYFDEDNN